MKKLVLAGLVVALAGCGGETETDKAVGSVAVEQTESEVVEVKEPHMHYMDVTPQQIREHMNELDQEVQRITHFNFDDIGENARQSRRMLALRDRPMPFGETIFDEPYGYCGSAEIFAVTYWYSMLDDDKNQTADDELKQYNDYKEACLEAVTAVENGEYQP